MTDEPSRSQSLFRDDAADRKCRAFRKIDKSHAGGRGVRANKVLTRPKEVSVHRVAMGNATRHLFPSGKPASPEDSERDDDRTSAGSPKKPAKKPPPRYQQEIDAILDEYKSASTNERLRMLDVINRSTTVPMRVLDQHVKKRLNSTSQAGSSSVVITKARNAIVAVNSTQKNVPQKNDNQGSKKRKERTADEPEEANKKPKLKEATGVEEKDDDDAPKHASSMLFISDRPVIDSEMEFAFNPQLGINVWRFKSDPTFMFLREGDSLTSGPMQRSILEDQRNEFKDSRKGSFALPGNKDPAQAFKRPVAGFANSTGGIVWGYITDGGMIRGHRLQRDAYDRIQRSLNDFCRELDPPLTTYELNYIPVLGVHGFFSGRVALYIVVQGDGVGHFDGDDLYVREPAQTIAYRGRKACDHVASLKKQ